MEVLRRGDQERTEEYGDDFPAEQKRRLGKQVTKFCHQRAWSDKEADPISHPNTGDGGQEVRSHQTLTTWAMKKGLCNEIARGLRIEAALSMRLGNLVDATH